MSKFIFINIYLLLAFLQLSAQIVVVESKTERTPIQGALVYEKISKQLDLSNEKGEFNLDNFNAIDTLQISKQGYITFTTTKNLLKVHPVISLTEEVFLTDEVIISASKFEESTNDVARQVQVIKEKNIKNSNQQTTADLLQHTGNVFVQKSQMGGGSPILRGFEANKILLVVDGVRLNNAIYRGGHLQNVISVDNNMLDRTEVLFGAGAVVYGSDALGGVIHFLTKNPLLAKKNKTEVFGNGLARYSSANFEKTFHGDINIGFKKLGFLSSFTFSDFDDLKQGSNRSAVYPDFGKLKFYAQRLHNHDTILENKNTNIQKNSGYKQLDLMKKILYAPNRNITHIVNLQYSTTTNVPRYDRLAQFNKVPVFAEWYYGPQKRMLLAYHLLLNKKNSFYDRAKFILSFQDIEESRHDRKFGRKFLNHRTEKLQAYNLNMDFSKQFLGNEVRYGLEGTVNNVASAAYKEDIVTGFKSTLDTRYPNGGSVVKNIGAYFTHSIEFSNKFIFTEGIRYSYSNLEAKFIENAIFPFPYNTAKQVNSALNGSIGLVFLPVKNMKIFTNGATGYRVPNVDDLSKIFESVLGSVIVPNTNLKPENTYTIEAGLNKHIGNIVAFDFTTYYTIYKNAITTGNGTYEGEDSIFYNGVRSRVQQNINAGRGFIYGYNAGLKAYLLPNLEFYSSINYTYGRIHTDSVAYPLDHIPPVFGKSGIVFKYKNLRTELFSIYNGWKKLKDYNLVGEDNFSQATSSGMPAWFTLNCKVDYYINSNVHIQLGIDNLLDRNYRGFGSGISAPGRNFIVSVRANIGSK